MEIISGQLFRIEIALLPRVRSSRPEPGTVPANRVRQMPPLCLSPGENTGAVLSVPA